MFIVVTCYCVAGQESRSGSASRGFYDVYRSYGSSPSTREELPSMQMLQYGYKGGDFERNMALVWEDEEVLCGI